MVENIPKILHRVKGHNIVDYKHNLYKLIMEIDDILIVGGYYNVRLKLKEYSVIINEDGKQILLDGIAEFPVQSISQIHNATIRNELYRVLKHYGIEVYTYEIENPIS